MSEHDVYHISDLTRYLRCPRLFCLDRNTDKAPFQQFLRMDEKITDLARTYFQEPEEAAVTTYDGRAYLQTADRTYDVIMVDAFQDITIPFQMASMEFFTLVRDHLNPGGVMVVNMKQKDPPLSYQPKDGFDHLYN